MLIPTFVVLGGFLAPALVGGPGVEVVEISFDKNCAHDIATKARVKRGEREILVWRIKSQCRNARDVTIKPKQMNPFVGCVGDPRDFKVGSRFRIDAAASGTVKAIAVCTVDWEKAGVHKFKVEIPHLAPGSVGPRDHELALEVVP